VDAIKVLLKQLAKNAEKSPGWLPLSVLCYVLLWRYGTPDKIFRWPLHQPSVSPEVWTATLTLIAYQLGDVLDKIVYKKRASKGDWTDRNPDWLDRARQKAQGALGITGGSYQTSLALVHKAHEALFSADVLNECAKFLRSLFIPGLVAIALLIRAAKWKLSLTLIAPCVLILPAYVFLKLLHVRNLYEQTTKITESPKYRFYDLGETRLFFWNGSFVSSAPLLESRLLEFGNVEFVHSSAPRAT
jgi:hypothetical protein